MSPRALMVFGDASGQWWLRWLRPGFRHCFVVVECKVGWVVIDPAAHGVGVLALPPMAADALAAWYRRHNLTVAECVVAPRIKRKFPLAPLSCVEVVKRIVGIRALSVWTPWQLFRHATENRKKTIDTRVRTAYIQNISSLDDGIFSRATARHRDILKSPREQNMKHEQEDDMGGFFAGAPEPPPPPPMPALTDPEAEARKARQEAVARNRRGRAGMVAGDERGILTPVTGQGKSLLGE